MKMNMLKQKLCMELKNAIVVLQISCKTLDFQKECYHLNTLKNLAMFARLDLPG
ncbi:hypothetical protein MTR67_034067 [Solanum verrucosum]|uniref:Uncharacterized protein n=1 Tax=Solanum verrucosum TaxID=315347 RepID=A0AAF0ZIW6_SOLVR|nr:hypothetical protein MTR67_034067 [Solanum verrucosum]